MKGVKELGKYLVKVFSMILAVLMTAGFFLIPPALAAEDTANYRNMRFALYPEEESTEKSVVLNDIMPKNASAKAVDVTDNFTGISEDNPDMSLVAAYDITITSGKNEYQPDQDKPIQVEITDPKISEESSFELWHIKDNGEKEKMEDFTVENGKISFKANGFSVYAIVDISSPHSAEEIKTLDDLEGSRATAGFCLYYGDHKFFTNTLNSNGALTETNDIFSASKWFFTKTGDYYKISTIVNGVKKFIHTENGNRIELSENDADLFKITPSANHTFYLKNSGENKWLQHSGSGNGIRYYQSNSNSTNSRIKFVFADTAQLPDDWYQLNGKSYGLMNYPGGTLGNAFMAQESENCLAMLSLNVRRKTGSETLYVAEDSDITMWTFHYISDTKYKISTAVNGETKYLYIGDTLSLVNESQASLINITTDSRNHLKLSAVGKTVTFGENGFVSAATADNSVSQRLYLAELSELTQEDYITYYADKVSISNVPDGASVVIYTRIWNDNTKSYNFYAVDHDGTLYPCYERGDHLTWLGTRINTLLWDFTEYHYDDGTPNYYYELYNPYSRKYIAPRIQDDQVLSDSKIGINLPGRRYGDYYSDILAWDTPYYAYAGLQSAIENGMIISGPKAEADTFYFAQVEKPASQLTEVNTINVTIQSPLQIS